MESVQATPRPSTFGYPVPPGPSIIEKIWAELVDQLAKLLALQDEGEGEESFELQHASQSGHCLGIAKALSIILNPYDPNITEVRREAMRRYRARGDQK